MRFNNRSDNHQSHPHAMRLCREKWIEDVLQIVSRDTRTGVAYLDFRGGAAKSGRYMDLALICLGVGYRGRRAETLVE